MIIKTYDELAFFANMFKNGNADLLIIESKGGLGKSSFIESVMSDDPYLNILSHVTPLQLFILGYKYKDLPIIVDDVDGLLSSDDSIALLKMFCETKPIKEVAWNTTSSLLNREEIPQKFETKSKVCLLTNDFGNLTKKVSALKDRGWHLEFKPSNKEILRKIKEIMPNVFKNISYEEKREVFDLIERYDSVCEISLRTFVKGVQLYKECKEKGKDWKNILLSELEINPKLVLLNNLIERHPEDKKRIEEWEEQGLSKRSYYDYKRMLVQKCS